MLSFGAQELCESRGGRPGLPVPNKSYVFCGRKATFEDVEFQSSGAVWKSRWPSLTLMARTVSVDARQR